MGERLQSLRNGLLSQSRVRPVLGSALALGLLLVLQPAPAADPPRLSPQTAKPPETRPAGLESVTLEDVALDWNIAAEHEQSSDPLSSLSETLGAGICAIDFNRDGWMDLFFVGGRGHTRDYGRLSWWRESRGNRLLQNKEGHHFEDVTISARLDVPLWGMACTVADFDNDGFSDLVVTGVGDNRMFRNRGDSSFEDVTSKSGLVSDRWSTGAAVADFDGDGLLDLYVSNYVLFEKGARTFERTSGFKTPADIAFDHTLYDPEPNRLYLNRGGFRFKDVAGEMGVADSLGRGLGARWVDLNSDRWPDLVVINDHETPNQVYLNDAGRRFSRAGRLHVALELAGSHDVIVADFDNDGRSELFMTRGRGRPPVLLTFSNTEDRYVDVAWSRGVALSRLLPYSGWAAVAADMNNDGYLDLYVANGSVLPDMDTRFVPQAQPNSLFLNDGSGGFVPQVARSDGHRPHSSRGAIAVDLDNDGNLEIVVANNNDPLEVFSARSAGNNWLAIELNADQKDVEVYGATVSVETDSCTITRTVDAPQRFLSQGDPRIHVGLGKATTVKRLEVTWRDGSVSTFRNVAANQYVSIDRSQNVLAVKPASRAKRGKLPAGVDARDRETLLRLARILLAHPAEKQDMDELHALFGVAPPDVRVVLLDGLPEHFSARQLALLAKALRDPSPIVRLAAVRALRRAELERSASWLIPLLEDSNEEVQCAVAEAFRFFFDEEEAVTHRKGLAISALVRMLGTGSAQAKICAADALGASESTRAVLPLIALGNAEGGAVRAAAVRALGLIRDARALEPLRGLVNDPASEGTAVGAALIALSRLEDPLLEQTLTRILDPRPVLASDAAVARRYDVLSHLLTASEGVVFPRPLLARYLERIVREAPPRAASNKSGGRSTIAALGAIGCSGNTRLASFVSPFLSSRDPQILTEALVALASFDSRATRRQFEKSLASAPTAVIEQTLKRTSSVRWLTASFVADLFERPDASELALRVLRDLPRETASAAVDTLLRKRRPAESAVSLFELCTKAALQLRAPIADYEKVSSLELRTHYLACMLQGGRTSGAESIESPLRLRARSGVATTLSDPSLSAADRLSVLLATAKHDAVVAKTWLVKEIRNVPADRLPDALAALEASGTAVAAREFLFDMLGDAKNSGALRVQAAALLATTDRARVMEHLQARSEGQ